MIVGNRKWGCRLCEGAIFFRYKLDFASHLEICARKHPDHLERFNILKQKFVISEVRLKAWVSTRENVNQPLSPLVTFQKDTITNFFPILSKGSPTGKAAAPKITVEGANYALAMMMIDLQLPFALCEHESFKEYIHLVFMLGRSNSVLKYNPPSRRKLEDDIKIVCADTVQEFMTNGNYINFVLFNSITK